MGSVYLAHDPSIDRRVAVKVLPLSAESDSRDVPDLEKRFVLEARAAGRLNHPGIVSIYDTDIDPENRLAYIAMEWVDGRPLSEILEERGHLSVDAAAEIIIQVAKALDHAHNLGVIHRDIKPANIIIARDGRVKVLDFGIAKLAAESHTMIGQVLGTPAFMSPEQLQGLSLDGRCDLFSLGAVLFQCLTGRPPFEGRTVAEIVQKIMNLDPLPFEDAEVEVPECLWSVVAQALEKDPGKRFDSGRSLATALKPYLPSGMDSDPNLRALLGTGGTAGGIREGAGLSSTDATVTPISLSTAASRRRDNAAAAQTPPTPSVPRRGGPQRWSELSFAWLRKAPVAVAAALLVAAGLLAVSLVPTDTPPAPKELVGAHRDPSSGGSTAGEGLMPSSAGGDQLAALAEASLVVSHRNRLKSAWMSIWVDGERLWSEPITARGSFFGRARGDLIEVTLPMRPGKHTIEIRVTGAQKNVNASKVITGIFDAGESRNLRAKLNPISGDLELAWKG